MQLHLHLRVLRGCVWLNDSHTHKCFLGSVPVQQLDSSSRAPVGVPRSVGDTRRISDTLRALTSSTTSFLTYVGMDRGAEVLGQ